jgi:ferric-dicitrate binding protein FerR (iron transport regulator)
MRRSQNMKTIQSFPILLVALFFSPLVSGISWSQDDSTFHAVKVKGEVTAYHNENDETARLYTNQTVEDGDKVVTAADSEAVLRLNGKTYLYLAPHTKIHIMKLRPGDKGLDCQINLVTGRMLCQFDQVPQGAFEVTAGSVVCREHGTLFEVLRREDELTVASFEGVVVANFHGKTQMAKDNEVLKLNHGRFRNKTHHLTQDQQDHLQTWKDLLAEISGK